MSATTLPPAPALRAQLATALDGLLDRLSNFWFGMSMLGVWGFMTLIGVIVDQGKDADFYAGNYPPPLARLVLRLHLDNIYHSPAYIGIVGFILACMTLATFRRVIPSRLPPLRGVKIDAMPLAATVAVAGDESMVRARVEQFFAQRGWLVRKREQGGVEWTFADKFDWARRGVLVAHVGFVIIAIGTTLYWAFGYSGQTAVLTGSSVTIPESGAIFTLDRFRFRIDPIQTRAGTVYQPIDYVSDVHVTGKDGTTQAHEIRVNQPLSVDGTLYYQASYGFAIPFTVTHNGHAIDSAASPPRLGGIGGHAAPILEEGEGFALGQTGRAIQYARFVGTIGRGNTIAADPRPNAPGIVLSVFDGDENIGSVLVPLGHSLDLGDGYSVTPGHYILYSGIQYRHDPGIPFVALGAFVLLAGLCISFYLLPARLYVRVDRAADGCTVGMAATTVKGYDIYEEQFAALVSEFENAEAAR